MFFLPLLNYSIKSLDKSKYISGKSFQFQEAIVLSDVKNKENFNFSLQ